MSAPIPLDAARIREAARLSYLGLSPAGHAAEMLVILASALEAAPFNLDARVIAAELCTAAAMLLEYERIADECA